MSFKKTIAMVCKMYTIKEADLNPELINELRYADNLCRCFGGRLQSHQAIACVMVAFDARNRLKQELLKAIDDKL